MSEMSIHDHHMLCLGVLAGLYHKDKLDNSDLMSIHQAIDSAEQLGLPVSLDKLIDGEAIFKMERN